MWVTSKGMSEKIAKLGLCHQHLQLAYERNGEDGIQALFSEKFQWSSRNQIQENHMPSCSALQSLMNLTYAF